MVRMNHDLDQIIIDAAKEEFLQLGFRQASLRKIAAKASLTTGALYTRYESKDDLFYSLVEPFIEAHRKYNDALEATYEKARVSKNVDDFIYAIKQEEINIIDLIDNYSEACHLFFVCSEGSKTAKILEDYIEKRTKETYEFMKSISNKPIDFNHIKYLLNILFSVYKDLLSHYDKPEDIINAFNFFEIYNEAGWRQVFEDLIGKGK